MTPKTPPVTLSVSPYIVLFPQNISKQSSTDSSYRYSTEHVNQSSIELCKQYPSEIFPSSRAQNARTRYKEGRDQNSIEYSKPYYSDKKLSDSRQKRHSSACTNQYTSDYTPVHAGDYRKQSSTEENKKTSTDHTKVPTVQPPTSLQLQYTEQIPRSRSRCQSEHKKRHSVGPLKSNVNSNQKRRSHQFLKQKSFELSDHQADDRKCNRNNFLFILWVFYPESLTDS